MAKKASKRAKRPKTARATAKPSVDPERVERLRDAWKKIGPYQPLYGLDGFEAAQRGVEDRCVAIEGYFGRKVSGLRFVDVGCSFGYVTFFLADRGAQATGWDRWAGSIEVCNEVRALNGVRAEFEAVELGLESTAALAPNRFDVAVILSVLHWTVHQHGLEYVQRCMAQLMAKVPVVVAELAQKGEGRDLIWDAAAPARDLDVFNQVAGVTVEKIGAFASSVPQNLRPLYVVKKDAR